MSCDDYTYETITLYRLRDNAVTIVPYSDLAALVNFDMSDPATIVVANADIVGDVIVGNSIEVDSDDPSGLVYFNNTNPESEWRIYCKVGMFPLITAATYTLRITIIDTDNPNGLVLPGTDLTLQIIIVDLP